MAIFVQYSDDSYGYVQNHALDYLIDSRRIVAFRRASGWAEIGKDPVRQNVRDEGYSGTERRDVMAYRHCLICQDFFDSVCRATNCLFRKSMQGKGYSA